MPVEKLLFYPTFLSAYLKFDAVSASPSTMYSDLMQFFKYKTKFSLFSK